ncbi:MAG: NDP-sugar synthase [Candidatus Peribacteraceae bacterium]|nr:NDP-sugar synthase [Candidatus Peribacteraceae bacterium]
MQAFILAGGFATRLWPLTEKRAKPLLPLAGRPLISHLIEKIPEHIPVIVSTNAAFFPGFQEWESTVPLNRHVRLLVETSRSDAQKMGALGALAEWITQENVQDDILLLTGDNYLGFSLTHFLSAARQGVPLLASHDIGDRGKASSFGTVLVDPAHPTSITGFEEKPKEPKTSLVSTGCSLLPKDVLPLLLAFAADHPDNVGGIFEELLRKHIPVDCFAFEQPWLDIGSFSSYLEAHRLLVGPHALLDPDATLDTSACHGSVAIGAGSKVRGSELADCIVFDHCDIENCVLRNCIIDDHCVLRGIDLDDQMIRTGTVLTRS